MSPHLLEAIFVEREPLLQELLAGIRASLAPDFKRHALIVGPRGMGKTHLISLVYYRIREGYKGGESLGEHLRVAWMREEERGVATYFHLLVRILRVLSDSYADEALQKSVAGLSKFSLRDAPPIAEKLLQDWLGDKTLLVLVENFEDILSRIGPHGQDALRAFLQNSSRCVICATAPSITPALAAHTAPFYNFFRVHGLEEFSVETARSLMKLIAHERDDTDFLTFLDTQTATDRLRAIEDIAGGHPRIWILFAGFLTKDILDSLVPAFMKLIGELTPYYQSKMAELPAQEAMIVEYLCEKTGAQTVKDISEFCFLAPNAASAQLGDLAKKGFVRSEKLGRESHYELREPLLRLWHQVKSQQDKPLRIIIDFIKNWFTKKEAQNRYNELPDHAPIARVHFELAIQEIDTDLAEAEVHYDKLNEYWDTDPESGLEEIEFIIKKIGPNINFIDYYIKGFFLNKLHRNINAIECFDRSIELNPEDSNSWNGKGNSLYELEKYQDTIACYEKAIELDPKDPNPWNGKGNSLYRLEKYQDAIACYEKSIELDPKDPNPWNGKGHSLNSLERYQDALECFDKAIELDPEYSYPWNGKGNSLTGLEKYQDALECFDKAIELEPKFAAPWNGKGSLLLDICKYSKSIECFNIAINFDFNEVKIYIYNNIRYSISEIIKNKTPNEVAQQWVTDWKRIGAGYEELEIPIRMLEAAVEWKITRSRAALLKLEPEIRSKLEELLPPEARAGSEATAKTQRRRPSPPS